MLTRREFLIGSAAVGAVAIGSSAGLVSWDAMTRPHDSVRAWGAARGTDRLLLAATLAANSHNAQPWRFRVSDAGIDVLGDANRTMGKADPRLRELHVSLGCALENMVIAAADAGTPLAVKQVAGAPGTHFTRLSFSPEGESMDRASLAVAIPNRRTNRGPYDPERGVSDADLAALGSLAGRGVRVAWLTSPSDRAAFTDLSVEATVEHVADAGMQRDSHRWYRMRRAQAEENRDGVTVDAANLAPAASLALRLVPPSPDSFDTSWAKVTRETHCATAPAFGLLAVEVAGDHFGWIEAGRAFQRILLAASLRGIAVHPISQALALRDREVVGATAGHFSAGLQVLGGPGEVVLAFRIGHATREQLPSLRRAPVVLPS